MTVSHPDRQARRQFVLGQRAVLEEFLHQRFVGFGHGFDERGARGVHVGLHRVRDRDLRRVAAAIVRELPRLHRHQIDDAGEVVFFPDRPLHRDRRPREHLVQ